MFERLWGFFVPSMSANTVQKMPTDVKAVSDEKWYSCHKVTWSPTGNYLQFFDIPLSLIFHFTFTHYRNPLITPEAWNHWRCISPNAIWFSFLCQRFQRSQEVVSLLHMESSAETALPLLYTTLFPSGHTRFLHITTEPGKPWDTVLLGIEFYKIGQPFV